jgi:hypothetical protein
MADAVRETAIHVQRAQIQLTQDRDLLRSLHARLLESRGAIRKAERAYLESLEVLRRIDDGLSGNRQ